jgi:hypothetical protein
VFVQPGGWLPLQRVPVRRGQALSIDRLGVRLVKVPERYRDRWNAMDLAEQFRKLWGFADSLEGQKGGKRKGRKSGDCFH